MKHPRLTRVLGVYIALMAVSIIRPPTPYWHTNAIGNLSIAILSAFIYEEWIERKETRILQALRLLKDTLFIERYRFLDVILMISFFVFRAFAFLAVLNVLGIVGDIRVIRSLPVIMMIYVGGFEWMLELRSFVYLRINGRVDDAT